ncbi:anaerobic sulfite reductase subunit AsrA [Shimwellia blattae]|uniref:Anaerobic sulfite reductase subunit A n=1 Tax=Shimwellia blattae (strain ATCC 29907 / DSM 4481 / JCM 1650 / NBRC 105725 / CDC 9005-74) TaxID=630626 RepID=I2B5S5_SHIBC|nr:anaerobic sulfite reductase subunit AsrA [Shimwellia blattae]AFJ45879.1 anaerobic sulfite reductase subunit A [Shimwellia blattae DSM 4481 = NBRC 105725]GAB81639.1 anaerobic sulfite reductase subunit A [Shimwellia blattae DSM 4481 = NBRC 105725]VDY63357.1 anaerobic sulfite reductase subunit A [Shimwellia blattae]VEC21172.1 anaerobic sulfite reductase subunit A [Shimwellia blattae]
MAIKITPEEFNVLIRRLSKNQRVFAPSAEFRGGRFSDTDNVIYHEISDWGELVWKEKSHMSPNTILAPITETLFYFNKDTIQIADVDTTPVVIFARACDINALSRLDYMYLTNGNNSDYSYQRIREHIHIILMECEASFENCFCVSMGTNKTDNYSAAMRFSDAGASVSLNDTFLEEALAGLGEPVDYTPGFVSENPVKVATPDSQCDDPQKIREILINHPLWEEYHKRCISCGRCTVSCPTCTCYSVFDVAYEENPQRGERRRQWASCVVPGFSDMAGGHGFREKAGERLRYRALHKVNDYKSRNGIEHMCVGCGRCDDRCPQYIKFSLIINKMTDAVRQSVDKEA